jgi:4-diphosphocytidyl-2-C-methyl-D-erythritol kinase
LRAVLQTVSLCDYLDFARAQTLEIHAPVGITAELEQNLIYRAARKFLDRYTPGAGVRITLTKNIPLAAGLAGGSTDCAGALIGLNEFLAVHAPPEELEEIADSLGSDTAYCLRGGTYLATGRGELLQKLPELPKMTGLILKPPFPLSTAAVYARFSGQNTPCDLSAYERGEAAAHLALNMRNDLTVPALSLRPELKDYLRRVEQTSPAVCQMSGSGPAIFAFYPHISARDTAVAALSRTCEVYPVETVQTAQKILYD